MCAFCLIIKSFFDFPYQCSIRLGEQCGKIFKLSVSENKLLMDIKISFSLNANSCLHIDIYLLIFMYICKVCIFLYLKNIFLTTSSPIERCSSIVFLSLYDTTCKIFFSNWFEIDRLRERDQFCCLTSFIGWHLYVSHSFPQMPFSSYPFFWLAKSRSTFKVSYLTPFPAQPPHGLLVLLCLYALSFLYRAVFTIPIIPSLFRFVSDSYTILSLRKSGAL